MIYLLKMCVQGISEYSKHMFLDSLSVSKIMSISFAYPLTINEMSQLMKRNLSQH